MRMMQMVFCMATFSVVTMTQLYSQKTARQDSTGLPGDNFSLQGGLEMFKKAHSPEEFEKLLNTQDNHVNNLDLNGDGDIDYIRVIDKMVKDAHAFILQVPVSETENQDIAVLELEKTGDATAVLQIIGDEDIYGEQTIVEPTEEGDGKGDVNDDEGGGRPHYAGYDSHYTLPLVVNVWFWPSVAFVYAPAYAVWVSPWRWGVYPVWWRPWRPLVWGVFHPLRLRYHAGFVVVRTRRVVHAHRIYSHVRVTSAIVKTRHHASVNRYRIARTTTIKRKPEGTKVRARVGKRRR